MAHKDGWSDRGGGYGRGLLTEGNMPGSYKSVPDEHRDERAELERWARESPSVQKRFAAGDTDFADWYREQLKAATSPRPVRKKKPDIVRWSRERDRPVKQAVEPELVAMHKASQRARQLRNTYPEAFARADLMDGKQVSLATQLQDYMTKQRPAVDWGKVRVRQGYNIPGSAAWTVHNQISFKDPPSNAPGSPAFEKDVFHEIAHVPQWKSGRLTFPRYIAEALRAAATYATEAASTYGMHPATTTPPTDIWDRIPIEQEAIEDANALLEGYRKLYPDRRSRRIFK
jgi:hypothetical protein